MEEIKLLDAERRALFKEGCLDQILRVNEEILQICKKEMAKDDLPENERHEWATLVLGLTFDDEERISVLEELLEKISTPELYEAYAIELIDRHLSLGRILHVRRFLAECKGKISDDLLERLTAKYSKDFVIRGKTILVDRTRCMESRSIVEEYADEIFKEIGKFYVYQKEIGAEYFFLMDESKKISFYFYPQYDHFDEEEARKSSLIDTMIRERRDDSKRMEICFRLKFDVV